jgi:negative regulator of replication initiation
MKRRWQPVFESLREFYVIGDTKSVRKISFFSEAGVQSIAMPEEMIDQT